MKNRFEFTTAQTKSIEAIVGQDEMVMAAFHKGRYNPKDYTLISIQNPEDEVNLKVKQKKFKDCLSIKFNDVKEPIENLGKMIYPISDEEVKIIVDFILNHKNDKFFIHCAYGVSRSAGVGQALECILNYRGNFDALCRDGDPIEEHYRYTPNTFVRDKIIKYYNETNPIFEESTCKNCNAIIDETNTIIKNHQTYICCPLCNEEA